MQETIPAEPPDFLRGVIAPMLTPCRPDGSLDLPGVKRQAKWLAERRCVRTLFARSGTEPHSNDVMDLLEERLDALREPYRLG